VQLYVFSGFCSFVVFCCTLFALGYFSNRVSHFWLGTASNLFGPPA
jgi:hypothetical protein